MSSFDKESFLSQSVEAPMETKYTPLEEGDYTGFVEDVEADSWDDKPILIVTYNITDEKAKEQLERDKVTLTDRIFIEVEEDGSIATGPNKNVKLGQLRDAVAQNDAGAWSPSMLRSAGPVRIKLTHRFNKTTGEGPYPNVARVTAA